MRVYLASIIGQAGPIMDARAGLKLVTDKDRIQGQEGIMAVIGAKWAIMALTGRPEQGIMAPSEHCRKW